jgi:transmembrane sensor
MKSETNNERIQKLAVKWQNGTITAQEKAEFNNWYNAFNDAEFGAVSDETPDMVRDRILSTIRNRRQLTANSRKRPVLYLRIAAAAAAVLLLLSVSLYFFKDKPPIYRITKNSAAEIPAGTNKAVLTLANGTKINLDDALNGELASQSGVKVTKSADGQLIYAVQKDLEGDQTTYNTIETPKGGQYQVNLPDGTRVWLNAASSIKFPTAFSGKGRKVNITGEAYFEVAKVLARGGKNTGRRIPFIVDAPGVQINVLGTHFNINAYKDEDAVKTTLVEGSVTLGYNQATAVLKPGQQGSIKEGASDFDVSDADIAAITAWKNGLFQFDNVDLKSLMRQLSRWYNVEIVYEGKITEDVFFGKMERKANLSKVLKILEQGDLHFRLEGRKLIVLP